MKNPLKPDICPYCKKKFYGSAIKPLRCPSCKRRWPERFGGRKNPRRLDDPNVKIYMQHKRAMKEARRLSGIVVPWGAGFAVAVGNKYLRQDKTLRNPTFRKMSTGPTYRERRAIRTFTGGLVALGIVMVGIFFLDKWTKEQ